MRGMKLSLKIFLFAFISFIIIISGLYLFAYISPKIELKTANKFALYDDKDQLVFQGSGAKEWVKIEDVSQYLIDAVVSVEDRSFYKHNGFDYFRIAKAMVKNIASGDIVEGASTISQQYIKNMFLTFDQEWSRKIEEAFLTLRLEVHYDKDAILEGYLNTINYGNGNYGVQNASKYYFNKDAKDLNLEESVILAGIPKNPNNYNPVHDMDKAINRGRMVAKAMVDNGKLEESVADNLFQNDLEIYGKKNNNNLQTLMYYQDAVIEELNRLGDIPDSLIKSGGLKIYTNLNMDAQTQMEKAIIKNMSGSDLEVASIMINPKNGQVMALAGGYDYAVSQYNRATQAKRQVGSTMKPILYYAALENGFVSSSTFKSEKTDFNFSNNKVYSPANYNDKYANKEITMAAALSYSDNIYAVKTHLFLGQEVLPKTASRMGIKASLQEIPSLALGTNEISMLDFANAYTTLASGGYKKDLFFIRKVEDSSGHVLYEKKEKKDLVLNPNYTYILNELLTGSYNPVFIDYNSPTVLSFNNQVSRKYAIKTGTTDFDYWMVGYNPDVLMMIWNGKDDSSILKYEDNFISKKIWLETVEPYLKDKETKWYDTPENVVGVIQDPITGEFTTNTKKAALFYYVKGSEPQSVTINVSKEQKK